MTRNKLFISYSHKDMRWLERVREQLGVLEREDLIETFEDARISPGEDWYTRLDLEMEEARIALLLISPAFLTSDFIRREEIPHLFVRHESGGMQLYPLLVRDCAWQEVPWLARVQMRPRDARALASLRGGALDKCLADMAREIAATVRTAPETTTDASSVQRPSTSASLTVPSPVRMPTVMDEEKGDADTSAQTVFDKAAESSDPALATSLANLATLHEAQGRYRDAEETWRRVLSIRERAFGRGHPDFALTLQSLANLYAQTGRYAEAEALQLEALYSIEGAYGPDHPVTASALNALAVIYLKVAKYAEAAPFIERALEIRTRSLGAEHPDLVPLLENLAAVYRRAGDQQKVEQIEARVALLHGKRT